MSRIGAEASVGGDRRDPSSGLLASESAATYYSNVLDEGGHLFARLQWAGHVELDAEREEMEQRARKRRRTEGPAVPNSLCLGTAGQTAGGIGYELLRKAGWSGRGGLGRREQGISSPLAAWSQPGRQGIGAALPKPKPHIDPRSVATAELADAVQGGGGGPHQEADQASSRSRSKQEHGHATAPKKEWQTVKVEESVDTKVKRWRQVLQAEADEKAGKAIDRMMFRAFRDESHWDTNPLTRRNRLTASNPLL